MIISPLSPVPGVHVTKIISDTGTLGGAVGKLTQDDPVHVPEDPDISELVHHDVNKYELLKYPDPDLVNLLGYPETWSQYSVTFNCQRHGHLHNHSQGAT